MSPATPDQDQVCPRCNQPLTLVADAERRLPSGPLDVTRCPGCSRALWYRSNAAGEALYMRALGALYVSTQKRLQVVPLQPFLAVLPDKRTRRQGDSA
jgi:uncharacterized protein YbaR (Trm112 family)